MFKKILIGFFATLGVIFFCILVGLAYFIIADPFNLRPMVSMLLATPQSNSGLEVSNTADGEIIAPVSNSESTDGSSTLRESAVTPEQSAALESVGLSPSAISADQEACFVRILGQARVDEVKAGAVPSAAEFIRASECL
jgi:hypothetical protein